MSNLKDWIVKPEKRLKPTDLVFLDKQLISLMEASEAVEALVFKYPLSVILVKFADLKVQFVLVDTQSQNTLLSLVGRLDDWYEAYGIRAYSLKQAYDKQGFLIAPMDSSHYVRTEHVIPDYNEQWYWDVPLSLNQLPVEIKDIVQ